MKRCANLLRAGEHTSTELSSARAERELTRLPLHRPRRLTYFVTDRGDPDNCGAPGANCATALSSALRTISIVIAGVNDRPVASDLTVTLRQNTDAPITLQATDVDGDSLSLTMVSGPAMGTISQLGVASCTTAQGISLREKPDYTPRTNFSGLEALLIRPATLIVQQRRHREHHHYSDSKILFTSNRDGADGRRNPEIYVINDDGAASAAPNHLQMIMSPPGRPTIEDRVHEQPRRQPGDFRDGRRRRQREQRL